MHTLHSQAGQGVGEGVGLEYGRDRALAVPVTLDEGVDVKTLQRCVGCVCVGGGQVLQVVGQVLQVGLVWLWEPLYLLPVCWYGHRFGQASAVVPSGGQREGGLLVFGGFGPAPSAHGRLSDLMKLTLTGTYICMYDCMYVCTYICMYDCMYV